MPHGVIRFTLLLGSVACGLCRVPLVAAPVDQQFFVSRLLPILRTVQCDLCHQDNGVAAETALLFPPASASREELTAFGLSLRDWVDRQQTDQSLLLLKPTNREEHTGGVRLRPGSEEEQALREWVEYLARLSDDEWRQARAALANRPQSNAAPGTIRRLTHRQYNHAVRDLLGELTEPANQFPAEDWIRGFKNQRDGQGISPLLAEAYSKSAERIALQAFRGGDSRNLLPLAPQEPVDLRAAEAFIRRWGEAAFRRPLTNREQERFLAAFRREATRANDFYAGVRMVVETMLQSPSFLLRVERGEGELSQYATASRLAFFLWDTVPDQELRALAAAGKLATAEQIEAQVRRMLDDPRARESLNEFLAQWLRFEEVLGATRDRRRFSEFGPGLAGAMIEETRRLFEHLVWNERNFLEFFTADYTFLNADLARVYQLPEPPEGFARVSYPPGSGRSGVLGHAAFLVVTSNPAETSPTSRGLFVRNQFLGQEVPAPPPGINTSLPELTSAAPRTNRERLAIHLNSESCASCHRLIDPIGLGFEQYNPIGAFEEKMVIRSGGMRRGEQTVTVELPLDTSAHIQGLENSTFRTPRELGRILAGNKSCQRNIVKQLFRYAVGREETPADQPALEALWVQFRDSGFRFRELVVALACSPVFHQKGPG